MIKPGTTTRRRTRTPTRRNESRQGDVTRRSGPRGLKLIELKGDWWETYKRSQLMSRGE